TMHRLEKPWTVTTRIDVGAGSQPHTSLNNRPDIGEDVSKKVRGHHHVERFRQGDERRRRCVHQHSPDFHVREIPGDLVYYLIPQHESMGTGIRLRDTGHVLAPLPCTFEGVTSHLLHAGS